MDFNSYKCPVCDKFFEKDDDVVVCPECGAPHHRECYENEGHCYYEDKHSDNFSFDQETNENKSDDNDNKDDFSIVTCKSCKSENPKENFYCYKCGSPLHDEDKKQNTNNQNNNQQPFGNQNMPPFGAPFNQAGQTVNPFDPMAGLNNDDPVAENVNAGEMAKYIGKNTQYYLRVFDAINKFKSKRFNFSAFIFSGFYFLYRKMILLGAILSFLIISLKVAQIYIMTLPIYQSSYEALINSVNSGQYSSIFNIGNVSNQQLFFALLPTLLEFVRLGIMAISGVIANRVYYKHCTKKINKIKSNCDGNELNKTLESNGGVNLALAICVGVAYVAINYIYIFI